MPRIYPVQFNNVAVTAAQDLFELQAGDDKPIEIAGGFITYRDSETNEQLTFSIQRRTGAFTGGSGGSSPTIQKTHTVLPTAGFTAEANNTTRATGGTQEFIHPEGFPSQGGGGYVPIPECVIGAVQGEALIVGLENAPAASTNMNGVVYVREYP